MILLASEFGVSIAYSSGNNIVSNIWGRKVLNMEISPKTITPETHMLASPSLARDEQSLQRAAKIGLDLVLSICIIFLLLPLLLVVAFIVSLDGGPVLYRHKRIGRHGREFKCLKFRTMVTEADQVLANLLMSDPSATLEWANTRKLRCDPRITSVGRFLRQTSLDELPQIFNVLRLEMSLVGPRPIVEQELDRYGPHVQSYYHSRPGITGLWQVSGRSNTTYGRRVELDTWYVRHWTLWLDIKILIKTVPAVLFQDGAT